MRVERLRLVNWRNFKELDVKLTERMFIVGPNASGKSNLLDALRFLRDISIVGGGMQKAIADRGGIPKIRSLSARNYSKIDILIELMDDNGKDMWTYELVIEQEVRGRHRPLVSRERIIHEGKTVLERPDADDLRDGERLTQTHLEQINANAAFRVIYDFLNSITYLHLVPQLLRYPEMFGGQPVALDPYGKTFLEKISKAPVKTRDARLKKIEGALQFAIPKFSDLKLVKDEMGLPHLQANYAHWRSKGAHQQEKDFSDGTLRLIALLWSLLEGDSLLLVEEPELYLNAGIVRSLPAVMYRMQKMRKRQLLISTHSTELLSDSGISASEILVLSAGEEGTIAILAADDPEIKMLMEQGMSAAEVVFPAFNSGSIVNFGGL